MYVRVFTSLLDSTVWCESSDARCVWMTLMLMADREGFVFMTVPGLARRAIVPLEATEAALTKFLAPDPYSSDRQRDPESDGRRLESVSGGWRILNYVYYRNLLDAEARRQATRARVKRHRNAKGAKRNANRGNGNAKGVTRNGGVTPGNAISDAHSTAEADADASNPPTPPSTGGHGEAVEVDDVPAGVRKLTSEQIRERHALVMHFRARYSAVADPGFEWPIDVKPVDLDAAGDLLEKYGKPAVHEMIEFVVHSKPTPGFDGWSRVVDGPHELRKRWTRIDQRRRDAKDKPARSWSDADEAIFRRTRFDDWRTSVMRHLRSIPESMEPAARSLEARRRANKDYKFELDPLPGTSSKDGAAYPWRTR